MQMLSRLANGEKTYLAVSKSVVCDSAQSTGLGVLVTAEIEPTVAKQIPLQLAHTLELFRNYADRSRACGSELLLHQRTVKLSL
jgi:hypothetical protein